MDGERASLCGGKLLPLGRFSPETLPSYFLSVTWLFFRLLYFSRSSFVHS